MSKIIRTFTATSQDLEMLQAVARYHGFSKSATITSLIKKEFWRVFPAGTRAIRPDRGARVFDRGADRGERHERRRERRGDRHDRGSIGPGALAGGRPEGSDPSK